MYNHQQFVGEVLGKSNASDLQSALEEWNISDNFYERDSECFCGHDIADVFTLRNFKNGNVLPYVGSRCVKRFGPGMETKMMRHKQGRKKMKKGRLMGCTYDEVCRDNFTYIKWLIRKGPNTKEQRSLIEYARWLFGPPAVTSSQEPPVYTSLELARGVE